MFRNVRSTTTILMAILLVLSALGTIVAIQQYATVRVEKNTNLIRQSLDESFLIVMKSVGGESNPQLDKELARRKEIIEGVDSGAAFVTDQLEFRVIADVIAWCVVFVISVWALSLNNRKQA
jgi:hypothetical protein